MSVSVHPSNGNGQSLRGEAVLGRRARAAKNSSGAAAAGPQFAPRQLGYIQPMLALTPDATQAIERILTAPGVPAGAGVRIIPVAPDDGQPVTSELQVEVAEHPGDGDEMIEEAGARVFVQDSVCGYLADKLLDAEVVDERVRFSLAGQRS
jgi:Fe-S cluster assembly iron-binding protein IscA